MKNIKKHKEKHIPMIEYVKDSCLECPFFQLESHGNSASGSCHAPDLDRAIDNKRKSMSCTELKITGRYSSNSIIKVPIPDWCPLKIGDAIITIKKQKMGILTKINYDLEKKTLEKEWDMFD